MAVSIKNKLYAEQLRNAVDKCSTGKFEGKSFLVTGATGMIGSAVVDILMQLDDVLVYAVARNEKQAKERLSDYWHDSHFHFLRHDVSVPFEDMQSFDYLIHAASPAYPAVFASSPVETMTANFTGMYNILQLAKDNKAGRVLYVSSGEVYGELSRVECKRETDFGFIDPLAPRSCYPQSKRAAETLCASFAAEYAVDVVIARPSHVYGPTMTGSDNRAVSDFIRRSVMGEDVVMRSTGAVVRSYTYVLDAATAILTILAQGKSGEAYNVADDRTCLSIREIAEHIANYSGQKLVIELPDGAPDLGYTPITRQVMAADKLRTLGWEPLIGVCKGVEATIDILRQRDR